MVRSDARMKFGVFYEHQLPRPWDPDAEYRLLQEALERALLERLLEEPVFGIGVPGTRELVLVEHAELHARVAPDHGPGIRPGVLRGIHPASGFRTGSKLVTRSAACSKPIRTSTSGSARGGW